MKAATMAFVAALMIPAGAAIAASGGIYPAYPYAWSENLGWMNFNASSSAVTVTDASLAGYVWSENAGWISLHPSQDVYVHNDGQGNLSGFAWGEGIGYVDFSGVAIDAQGYFHGYANSAATGKISFNCANTDDCTASDFNVKTYWKPAPSVSNASSALPQSGNPPGSNGIPAQAQLPSALGATSSPALAAQRTGRASAPAGVSSPSLPSGEQIPASKRVRAAAPFIPSVSSASGASGNPPVLFDIAVAPLASENEIPLALMLALFAFVLALCALWSAFRNARMRERIRQATANNLSE